MSDFSDESSDLIFNYLSTVSELSENLEHDSYDTEDAIQEAAGFLSVVLNQPVYAIIAEYRSRI